MTGFLYCAVVVVAVASTGLAGLRGAAARADPLTLASQKPLTTAYVIAPGANYGPGTVTPIRTATNKAGAPITVGDQPQGAAIAPDGKTAYSAACSNTTDACGVVPIRTATNAAGPMITVGDDQLPTAIVIRP
jgi:DNA-binding beta-propeller fold protein YncE